MSPWYLQPGLSSYDHKKLIEDAAKKIKKDKAITAIAVSGISGCTIGTLVSFLSKKPLIVVRKGEKRNSSFDVESVLEKEQKGSYIVVDDLISSGNTMRRIVEYIKKAHPNMRPSHFWLYGDQVFETNNVEANIKSLKDQKNSTLGMIAEDEFPGIF